MYANESRFGVTPRFIVQIRSISTIGRRVIRSFGGNGSFAFESSAGINGVTLIRARVSPKTRYISKFNLHPCIRTATIISRDYVRSLSSSLSQSGNVYPRVTSRARQGRFLARPYANVSSRHGMFPRGPVLPRWNTRTMEFGVNCARSLGARDVRERFRKAGEYGINSAMNCRAESERRGGSLVARVSRYAKTWRNVYARTNNDA